jgi:mannosyltransferase OCH1-like enzyme
MIQKNIFQTFYTKDLHENILKIIDTLKTSNPEYNYQLFDDAEMRDSIDCYSKDIKNAYDLLQIGAAKADFWRYLILYKHGGVYLDIDSQINHPIDSIIKPSDMALLTRERNYGSFVQWCLFFEKEHPLLKEIIQTVASKILQKENIELDKITGPPIMSRAIEKYYSGLNFEKSIYDTPDEELNMKIADAYFMGYDYESNCTFKHEYNKFLYEPYTKKVPWKLEQQYKKVIKNEI